MITHALENALIFGKAGTYAWNCTCMDKRLNITWHVDS